MVPINLWAVLVAAIASMILGFLWYGPIFGKQWMAMMGLTKESMANMKMSANKAYALGFAGSIIMAYVLAHALAFANAYLGTEGIYAGVMVGFWNWLGFIAPVTLGIVLWENKPWKLWILNSGYYIVSLIVMGVILALW